MVFNTLLYLVRTHIRSSHHGSVVNESDQEPRGAGSIPGLAQWVKDPALLAVSCGILHRCSSDPKLLCLWYRPAATAPIRPLAREPPCAEGVALEKTERQEKEQTLNKTEVRFFTVSKKQSSMYTQHLSLALAPGKELL